MAQSLGTVFRTAVGLGGTEECTVTFTVKAPNVSNVYLLGNVDVLGGCEQCGRAAGRAQAMAGCMLLGIQSGCAVADAISFFSLFCAWSGPFQVGP